jgi:hypothetical protein
MEHHMNAQAKVTASHKTIAAALAAAQMEMGKALKSANNPHFKSKYADLASVSDACMPALNAHGIAVIQPTTDDEAGRYVETILLHGDSGETLKCRVPLIVSKNDMQGYGSAVTYARRYGLMSMAGISPEDDDGNAAAKSPPVVEDRKQDRFDVAAATNRIKASLAKSDSLDDLRARWQADAETIQRIKAEAPGFYGEIDATKNARKAELEPRPSDSVTADEIPY